MIAWLMLLRDPGTTRYVPAEAPCWKGELDLNLQAFHIVIGWQRETVAR